ncbi:MAG TPA: two-component regulator propeller domain-containing protein, partial [Pyrinomonadaceae bacterium]|nr:two-component regulator propeller domain-containing protein [Pyrinomonadaceae bacterium]
FSLLLFCAINSSTLQAEKLPVKIYTTADGLGRDQINRIVQDSHGFLWFCTAEGLSRFDGYKFANYTTANGLAGNAVTDLLETREGNYLVATTSGLSVLNPNGAPMFSSWRAPDPGAEEITTLLEDHEGRIWLGTIAGLYLAEKNQGEWRFHFVDLGLRRENYDSWLIETLIQDRSGSLWIGTRGSGLCRYWGDGRVEHFRVAQGLPNDRVTALLEDRTGRLWVGTSNGLCRLVNDPKPNRRAVANIFTVKDDLTDNWIATLFQSAEGKLFAGSRGLSELVDGQNGHFKFRSFTTAQGLSDNNVQAIAEDRDGNLWLGTVNGGAMKIARNGFNNFIHTDGLAAGEISSIFSDRAGQICAFLRDRGGHEFIARFNGQDFASIQIDVPAKLHNVGWGFGQQAFQGADGEWWTPTGEGLYLFPSVSRFDQLGRTRPKAVYDSKSGLPTDEAFSLFQDSKGDLWIGSISPGLNGLSKWDRSSDLIHTFTQAEGLPAKDVLPTIFGEDQAGDLWVGFSVAGVARYREGRFSVFTTNDGAPEGWMRAIYCDHSGRLWISGGQGGVRRIDEPQAVHPKFISYTVAEGLSSNQVNCITEDQWGRMYFGTGRGLDRLDPVTGHIKHFTAADGLVSGRVRFAVRDGSGALWFANETELSRLIPEPDRPEPEPPILIDRLQIAGVAIPLSELGESQVGPLELTSGQNQVSIEFVGLEFDPGEALRYQHKLEGADRDWSAPSTQRIINYEHLSPGSYRFQVRAVTADGVISRDPAIVAFTIPPPLWRRWWFFTLAFGLLGLLVYTAHHYRVARLIELERVRTRIATDLHDDIGSNLSQIALLSEVVRQQVMSIGSPANERLAQIADIARETVESMRDIVWAINPQRDRFSDLAGRMRRFADDTLSARDIALRFIAPINDGDTRLGPDVRREVFLIFKETINNIVRHSECREAEIKLQTQNGWLILQVSDDGQGLDCTQLNEGQGLSSIRERAKRLGGECQFISNGKGTTVILRTPLDRRA